jgi:hypothetical protein
MTGVVAVRAFRLSKADEMKLLAAVHHFRHFGNSLKKALLLINFDPNDS